eukprot:Filipodium_phascolosomae@DN4927_c0_g1_i1.p1
MRNPFNRCTEPLLVVVGLLLLSVVQFSLAARLRHTTSFKGFTRNSSTNEIYTKAENLLYIDGRPPPKSRFGAKTKKIVQEAYGNRLKKKVVVEKEAKPLSGQEAIAALEASNKAKKESDIATLTPEMETFLNHLLTLSHSSVVREILNTQQHASENMKKLCEYLMFTTDPSEVELATTYPSEVEFATFKKRFQELEHWAEIYAAPSFLKQVMQEDPAYGEKAYSMIESKLQSTMESKLQLTMDEVESPSSKKNELELENWVRLCMYLLSRTDERPW